MRVALGFWFSSLYTRMEVYNAFISFNFILSFNFGKRFIDLALSVIFVFMLFIVMFSLGCIMEFGKIKVYFWKFKGLVIVLVV